MLAMKLILIAGLMLAANISACAAAPVGQGGGHALSDADLVRYQASAFDKRAMMFKHVRLGLHHGVAVVADFPCGDLCPEYTTRIIHYDVTPGPACAKAGGVEEPRMIPRGIAVTRQPFCVPGVLAGKGR
jgi:hypothetical protein